MARILKTEAFVIKKKSLLNKDTVITLFSQEKGKIKVFAKGIKKITSRRLPHSQTGNLIEALIHKKQDRLSLQETKLISLFSEIKKDSQKINNFYLVLFILDRLLPEGQKEEPIYLQFKKFIIELSKSKNPDGEILTRYLNEILRLLGYVKHRSSFSEIREIIEETINEKIPDFVI